MIFQVTQRLALGTGASVKSLAQAPKQNALTWLEFSLRTSTECLPHYMLHSEIGSDQKMEQSVPFDYTKKDTGTLTGGVSRVGAV